MSVYYETGIEEPEIMGSGSQFTSVQTTSDEAWARELFSVGGRNYLWKVTTTPGRRVIEEMDRKTGKWVPKGLLGSYQPSSAQIVIEISREEMKKLGFEEFPNDSSVLVAAIHEAISVADAALH